MSRTSNRCRWIASVALLWAANAHAVAPPPDDNGLPLDPCRQGGLLQWGGVQLVSSAGAADRDGLWFQATLQVGPGLGATGGLPPATTIGVEVVDDAGTVAVGSVSLMPSYMSPGFAWQPAVPLAADAQYTVKVLLANNAPPQCADPPDVMQMFAITTIAGLTPAPPEAPLRAIAYGQAWTELGNPTCCEPRDATACGGAETCAKCWSARREPTIVPVWDAQSMSSVSDPLEYALYYGKLTAIDPNTATGFGFGTALPALVFRPASFPNVVFSESQSEVCMTAATRNIRTGAVTLLPRCAPVTHDDTGLRGIALPDGVTFSPPADSTLTIGPAACLEPLAPYERDEIEVAASFHTSGDTCWPECGVIFPRVPVPPGAAGSGGSAAPIGVAGASMQPSEPEPWDDGLRGPQNDTGGCQVGAGAAAANPLWIGLALWLVRRLRRSESGSRHQKFTRGVPE